MSDTSNTIPRQRLPLFALFAAHVISATGDAMAAVAIPWYVLQTTGDPVQTGVASFFSAAPIVIGMFFGGTLVDRTGYRRTNIVSHLGSGVTILLIPILALTIGLSFPALLALLFLTNLLDAPGKSAQSSMLPELAKAAGVSVERAAAWNESLHRITFLIGAPLAGFLIVAIGANGVLLVDALTFFVSAALVGLLISAKLVPQPSKSESSYIDDMREGFRYVRGDALILTTIAIFTVTNMTDVAWGGVALPVYMDTTFGAEAGAINLGLIVGAFSVGALLGGLVYSHVHSRGSRRWLLVGGMLAISVRYLFFIPQPPLAVLVIVSVVGGFAAGPINPIFAGALYRRIPVALRARVLGLLSAGILVASPLGGLLGGVLLSIVGLTGALLLFAAVYGTGTTALALSRGLADLDAPDEETSEPVTA